jgi:hypothetical protein
MCIMLNMEGLRCNTQHALLLTTAGLFPFLLLPLLLPLLVTLLLC